MDTPKSPPGTFSFWHHKTKLAVVFFWLVLAFVYWTYGRDHQLGPHSTAHQLVNLLRTSQWGPLLYVAAWAIQPFIFFPTSVLTFMAGYVFGPAVGLLYATIGHNISAWESFLLGRYFGYGLLNSDHATTKFGQWVLRIRKNGFHAVLLARLLLLPYEYVSMFAGFVRVPWRSFALANVLGSLPGLAAVVLAGSSLQGAQFTPGKLPRPSLAIVGASVALAAISIGLWRYLQIRETRRIREHNSSDSTDYHNDNCALNSRVCSEIEN